MTCPAELAAALITGMAGNALSAESVDWVWQAKGDAQQDFTTIIFDSQAPNQLACDTTVRPMPDGSWVTVMLGGGHTEPLPANRVFISRSRDQGKTWPYRRKLVPESCDKDGRIDYPDADEHAAQHPPRDEAGLNKPERSCSAVNLRTARTFVARVLVHQVDVTDACNWWVPLFRAASVSTEERGAATSKVLPYLRAEGPRRAS